jgi:hypothetical protein
MRNTARKEGFLSTKRSASGAGTSPGRSLRRGIGILAGTLGLGAGAALAAQADICENKTGQELIRCIEAAARASAPPDAGAARKPAPSGERPATSRREHAAPPPPAAPTPVQDCTGREGAELRRCLAAGGRLSPESAIVDPTPAAGVAGGGPCKGKSGEPLRACLEEASKQGAAGRIAEPPLARCVGYTAADQPLCLHRNSAIIACRNRKLYPDLDVCLRSQMAGAPLPERADCNKVPKQARAHCEARNRVYAGCSGDKMGYFNCLEQKLGEDAMLPTAGRPNK